MSSSPLGKVQFSAMKLSTIWLPLAALVATATAAADAEKMNAVEEVFRRTWDGYRKYAWGHDSLRPISNSHVDDRYGISLAR